jgi:hypothetical protein
MGVVTTRYRPTPDRLERDIRDLFHVLWRALAYLDSIGNRRKVD